MELLRNFDQITKNDVSLAGGKGASLGEMTRFGIPVPPGFVILSFAFEKFLEETDLSVEIDSIMHSVNHKEIHTIESASEKIKALILAVEMPHDITTEIQKFFKNLNSKYVAVRSSATAEDSASAAWAGQLESYLNTTEANFLENVKKCWASLFTPRAIFYRFEKNLHKQKISVAVVVQKMVESEKSGIAFSVHPVTQDYNQLIIEAGLGLGEAIVSGQITPDSYVVEKQPRRIIDRNVQAQNKGLYRSKNGGNEWHDIPKSQGEKQALSDDQIFGLSELILKIENHYNFPCDIEWVFENGKFYITQSRPITTLKTNQTNMITLPKLWQREFPLSLFQIWGRSYKVFLGKKIEVAPRYVFILHDELGDVYRNPELTTAVNAIIIDKTKNDPVYLRKFHDNYLNLLEKLRLFWNRETLTQSELASFLKTLFEFWPAIYASWFIPPSEVFRKEDRDLFLDFRGKIQHVEHDAHHLIIRAIQATHPEIKKLAWAVSLEELGDSTIPDMATLKKRASGKIVVLEDEIVSEDKFREAKEKFDFDLEKTEDIIGVKEISGQVAAKGKITGVVRKVLKEADIPNLKDGEILVTSMTLPTFAQAMKKAGAFVTDEGGVTCHAAINAREMHKPCVIGTKIATQVLNNGDLIEVDADEGKILVLKTFQ